MRKLMFVTLILAMWIALGACAQKSSLAAPTDTPQGITPTLEPVSTPIQKPTTPQVSNEKPPFDLTSILADLASQAKVPVEQVTLTYWQPVEWRDSCLGVHIPKQGCLDVITPGFVLLFQAGQTSYAVHTNETGQYYVVAQDTAALDQLPAVSWTRSGGFTGICQNLTVYSTGAYWLRDCNTDQILTQGALPEGHLTYLSGLWEQVGTFEWNSVAPAGSADMFNDQIKLYGRGTKTMTTDEQQKLDQYLEQLANELSNTTGSNGSNSGIIGQVWVGPTCGGPVRPDTSTECPDKPYPTTITVLDPAGQVVTQFTTDSEGHFRVLLQPGSYTLHPESSGKYPTASDQKVQVVSGEFLTVTITYDSGIR